MIDQGPGSLDLSSAQINPRLTPLIAVWEGSVLIYDGFSGETIRLEDEAATIFVCLARAQFMDSALKWLSDRSIGSDDWTQFSSQKISKTLQHLQERQLVVHRH